MTETLAEKAREVAEALESWEAFTPSNEEGWYFVDTSGVRAIRRMAEVVAALAAKDEA